MDSKTTMKVIVSLIKQAISVSSKIKGP